MTNKNVSGQEHKQTWYYPYEAKGGGGDCFLFSTTGCGKKAKNLFQSHSDK